MNYFTAIKTCLTKYATFNGRASRSEYWWFILFNAIVQTLAAAISQDIFAIVGLALLLPVLAVTVRRLHDLDHSGWWYLIIFLPAIGILVLLFWMVTEGTNGPNQYGNPVA
jgi:uncharacterized membrane protein YhaH (DUF805 family)